MRNTDLSLSGHRDCTACGLHEGRLQVVPGFGNPGALIAFVGEAPGSVEQETGRPFVGPAGTLLRNLIAYCGMNPEDYWYSNLVHCRPPSNDFSAAMALGAVVCRTRWLLIELDRIRPWVVVAVGAHAGRFFFRDEKVSATELSRRVEGDAMRECVYVGMFHPSYALRSGESLKNPGPVIESMKRSLLCAQVRLHRRSARGGLYAWPD